MDPSATLSRAARRSRPPSPRPSPTLWGVVTVVVTAGMVAALAKPPWGWFDSAFVAVVAVVSSVAWGVLVVRSVSTRDGNGRPITGVVCAVAAFAANAFFYTGVPFVLGSAAVLLGFEGRRRADAGRGRARMSTSAVAIGALAIVAWLLASINGSMNHDLW